jgi:hypothetical protein
VVKPLVVAPRHLLGHLFHVAPVALKQAVEVTLGGILDRAGPALKTGQIGAEMIVKVDQCRPDELGNAFGILRPSWTFEASLNSLKTMACILPHGGFRWLGRNLTK